MNEKALSTTPAKVCVLLLQLGGPRDQAAIAPFLQNLFEDVLPLPRWLRRPLAGVIARLRAPKVAPLYAELGGGSPLLHNTEVQARALSAALSARGLAAQVLICMRYAPPRLDAALATMRAECPEAQIVALSLYPQYSFATSRSSLRELQAQLNPAEAARLRAICAYPTDPAYLDAMAARLTQSLEALPKTARAKAHLVFSAHGLPMKLVREGDPYPQHIAATVAGVMQRLGGDYGHTLCYQSRVGPVAWLQPSTQDTMVRLGKSGHETLVVIPVAFTSEHIETLHELDIQLREVAQAAGVKTYTRVPTVGDHPAFIDALAAQVEQRLHSPGQSACCGLYAGCELGKQAAAPGAPKPKV